MPPFGDSWQARLESDRQIQFDGNPKPFLRPFYPANIFKEWKSMMDVLLKDQMIERC